MKFNFGKYKDRMVDEIMDIDPSYCKWLYGLDVTKDRSPDLYKMLDDRFKDDNNTYMSWGKHKGRSIQWIKDNDENYFNWLKDNDTVQTKHKYLFDAIQKISF